MKAEDSKSLIRTIGLGVSTTATSALLSPCATQAKPVSSASNRPRVVLQITVDALRGDLPQRFTHVLGDGGFRLRSEKGVQYTNANYEHANTETIVGHASLATGTVPAA